MDLYFPPNSGKPSPVVLYVHGGAWKAGDKTGGVEISAVPIIASRGYLVAAINYRLAPQFKWPAQIQDVKCAVRFLRAHAATYNLDPDHIAALGASAGGHLVAMVGLAGPEAGFDTGEYLDRSSRLSAVVDLFGPANLRAKDFSSKQADVAREVFGARTDQDPVLVQASPVTYITKTAPPFLILQGEKDSLVPPSQSQELYDRLKAAGVPATLVMVKNAEHGFAAVGGPISPNFSELTRLILEFLDSHLK
jgi:acetyl esterase/lipase